MEEKNKKYEKLVRDCYRVLNEAVKALYSNNNDVIKPLCLEIIKNSIIAAEWYSYDNWNGGFNIYDIICLTVVSLYVKIQPNIEAIYIELYNQFNNL